MKKIQLGIVGKARGLKGEFYVRGREEAWPDEITRVYLGQSASSAQPFKVKSFSAQNENIILKLEKISSREDLEPFRLAGIWCDAESLEVDYASEYLWEDLVDLEVISLDEVHVGRIYQMENFGAHDIAVIHHDERSQQVSLPFVEAYFDLSFADKPEKLKMSVDFQTIEDLYEDMK